MESELKRDCVTGKLHTQHNTYNDRNTDLRIFVLSRLSYVPAMSTRVFVIKRSVFSVYELHV
jgi:hypothetical protein